MTEQKDLCETCDATTAFLKIADIDSLTKKSEACQVVDEDSAKNALSMALQSRKIESALEASRIEITRPHLDFQRAVNKLAKDFKSKLEAIETRLHMKIGLWMKTQKDNPFTCTESLNVEDGMIYTKTVWDFDVLDERLIPDEFKIVDAALIEKAVKNGIRNIPGVKIFQTETTQLRVKNT